MLKQAAGLTGEEGLNWLMKQTMDCISIIINCLSQGRRTFQPITPMI